MRQTIALLSVVTYFWPSKYVHVSRLENRKAKLNVSRFLLQMIDFYATLYPMFLKKIPKMCEHSTFKIPLRLVECCLLLSSQKQLTQARLVRGTRHEIEAHQIQNKSFLFDKSEVNAFMLGGKEIPQIIMLRSREAA